MRSKTRDTDIIDRTINVKWQWAEHNPDDRWPKRDLNLNLGDKRLRTRPFVGLNKYFMCAGLMQGSLDFT